MNSKNEMPLNLAIELYFEKHHALRQANLEKLIAMKKAYPTIFTKKVDEEIRGVILYAKQFQQSDRYKALQNANKQDPSLD